MLSAPPTIVRVDAIPVRLARDMAVATGTAGTPTALGAVAGSYRWSSTYPVLYSEYVETTLVKVSLSDGVIGWGEAQAPVAPRVAATIIHDILGPVLEGAPFDGERATIESLWTRMYHTMRVRGQTGGFMLDAISGIDIALWDIAGKLKEQSVAALLSAAPKEFVPAYLSGLSGADRASRLTYAADHAAQGFRIFKLYHDGTEDELLALVDDVRQAVPHSCAIAVDALWRLGWPNSAELIETLDQRALFWLECPFFPEQIGLHRALRGRFGIPLAAGESYRTTYELEPFFSDRLLDFVQPDLGRTGITGAFRIAEAAARHNIAVVPHVSVALGPQIAAAVHAAAALSNCELCEFNATVLSVCNRFLDRPLRITQAQYAVPSEPGLGVELRETDLRAANLFQ